VVLAAMQEMLNGSMEKRQSAQRTPRRRVRRRIKRAQLSPSQSEFRVLGLGLGFRV
jgi:hypothetical protein